MELELRLPALSAAVLMLAMTGASALTPFPKPEPTDAVQNGTAAPFVGNWEIVAPTMTMGEPDQNLAVCSLPVRIEAVDDRTLIYRQPGETRTGQIMTLTGVEGGTLWTPGDGSDADFTFWVSPEGFYLYDDLPVEEADWGFPYIFRRCP